MHFSCLTTTFTVSIVESDLHIVRWCLWIYKGWKHVSTPFDIWFSEKLHFGVGVTDTEGRKETFFVSSKIFSLLKSHSVSFHWFS